MTATLLDLLEGVLRLAPSVARCIEAWLVQAQAFRTGYGLDESVLKPNNAPNCEFPRVP